MDLNGDGCIDILSGSYSRHDRDMAGLLQVLWGEEDGTFRKAEALLGTDGEPLILPAGKERSDIVDKICTRPFAADLDGDGKLDLVVGNFRGTFGVFAGDGDGRFAPEATWLEAGGDKLRVSSHGDPFLVDWDGDGDLDLLSGSAMGGTFLFVNEGTRTAPRFGERTTLFEPAGHVGNEPIAFGDAHCTAPAADTRVWVDDVDGDGALDLLVGDMRTLYFPADGLDEDTVRARHAEWMKEQEALVQTNNGQMDAAAQKAWQEAYQKLYKAREEFLREQMTGFVWLLRQKPSAAGTAAGDGDR